MTCLPTSQSMSNPLSVFCPKKAEEFLAYCLVADNTHCTKKKKNNIGSPYCSLESREINKS
jgi:hypothetical protein